MLCYGQGNVTRRTRMIYANHHDDAGGMMRFVTYTDGTSPRPGVIQDDHVIDIGGVVPDILTMIEGGGEMQESVRAHVAAAQLTHPLHAIRLLAPIPRPRKNIVCLGKNYAEHAAETARALGRPDKLPDHPIFFTKAVTSVAPPDGEVVYDARRSTQLDWEVELAVILGRSGTQIAAENAMDYVFGYTVINDLTARDIQKNHKQFYRGKSLDGFAPMGPCIVTRDEIPDPHALALRLRVNGQTMQDGNTRDMIFPIPVLIAILSDGMTLEAGDIIATGTPAGVGMGMEPPRFLVPGDVVEAEVEGIGVVRTRVVEQIG